MKPGDAQGELAFLMTGVGYVGTSERPAPVSSNLGPSSLLRRNILNPPSQPPETHQLPSPLSPQAALLSEPPAKLLAIAWLRASGRSWCLKGQCSPPGYRQ